MNNKNKMNNKKKFKKIQKIISKVFFMILLEAIKKLIDKLF